MKFMLIVCVITALYFQVCESKRGSSSRGSSSGGGWFGGGSKSSSSSSSSGGWFGGGSKSTSTGSSGGGWFGGNSKTTSYNTNSAQKNSNTNYGWNVGNTQTAPKTSGSYGGGNTYVNNYYGGSRRSSSGSSFLTYGLLYNAGRRDGSYHEGYYIHNRRWDNEEDRRWRATTKAPYFENKQPGSESVLPAAAVLGVATAFGLYSLLPLNVPNGKPILSCNATELQQIQINFNGSTYGCSNKTVTVSCFKVDPITNVTMDFCPGKTLECDKTSDIPNISCTNGTLLSSESIFCNSTTIMNGINVNDTSKILNCYVGTLPSNIAGSIPTQAPGTKPLTIGAYVYKFLLWLMGKSDILEMQMPTTTPAPESFVPRFLSDIDTMATVSNETITE